MLKVALVLCARPTAGSWLCMDGYVVAAQSVPVTWDGFQPPTSTFRLLWFPDVVGLAKANGLYAANLGDWYIDGSGRACLYNAFTVAANRGLVSYVSPIQLPGNDTRCRRLTTGGAGVAAAAAVRTGGTPREVAAVPLPQLTSEVPCKDPASCGIPMARGG